MSKRKKGFTYFSLCQKCTFASQKNFFIRLPFIRLGQLNLKFIGHLLLLLLSLFKNQKHLAPEDSCNGRKKEMTVDAGLELWILSMWAYQSMCVSIITLNLFSAVFKKWLYEMHKMISIITLKRKIVIIALPLFGMAKKDCVVCFH